MRLQGSRFESARKIRYIFDMATRTSLPVSIASRDNRSLPSTSGSLTQVEWTKPERSKNALKTFGMWFGFTFAAIFIPIAHYFLVPTLFITSFILGLGKLNETLRNEGGTGECPQCHENFTIQASKLSDVFTDTCEHCKADLEVTLQTHTPSV